MFLKHRSGLERCSLRSFYWSHGRGSARLTNHASFASAETVCGQQRHHQPRPTSKKSPRHLSRPSLMPHCKQERLLLCSNARAKARGRGAEIFRWSGVIGRTLLTLHGLCGSKSDGFSLPRGYHTGGTNEKIGASCSPAPERGEEKFCSSV